MIASQSVASENAAAGSRLRPRSSGPSQARVLRRHAELARAFRTGAEVGFTLLEVMVALLIVAIAFVGLLGIHNRNLRQVGRDQDITRATLLARELIAQMEVTEKFPDTGVSTGEFESQPGYLWEREVTETELPTIRQVVVRIIFDERRPNAYELLYYVRDRTEPEPLG